MQVWIISSFLLVLVSCTPPHSRQKRSRICYDGMECFENLPPFDNADGLLPQPPNHIGTVFRLFTRTCTIPRVLHQGDTDPLCGFDSSLSTKIICHGFLQHGQVTWVKDMTRELLKKEPMNVITVDWGNGSGFPYSQAVANTRIVGFEIARLLNYLRATNGLTMDKVHIIGHSLGAHIAGYTGNRVPGIARITGLDPAEPDFKDTNRSVHLDKTDALFVDIIHTDGSEFNYDSGYGWIQEVGHIDFYPNGGENQPGCPQRVITGVLTAAYYQGLTDAENELSCSHSRSIRLFNESINSRCLFYGHPCASLEGLDSNQGNCLRCERGACPMMGYYADQTQARGKFYLRTRSSGPFCGNTQHIEVEFGYMAPVHGLVTVELDGDDQTTDSITFASNDQPFASGEMRRVLFVDREQVDHVSQVRVTYNSTSSGSWWWYEADRSVVVISKVTVTSAENGRRIHFCGDHAEINNGNTVTLTRSSTDPIECRLLPPRLHGTLFHHRRPPF